MKTFAVEGTICFSVMVQADSEEDAISQTVEMVEWPGNLLSEEYKCLEDGFGGMKHEGFFKRCEILHQIHG